MDTCELRLECLKEAAKVSSIAGVQAPAAQIVDAARAFAEFVLGQTLAKKSE